MTKKQQTSRSLLFADIRVRASLFIIGLFILTSIFAPWIAPYQEDFMSTPLRLASPSNEHILGNDINGADVLTSLLYGGRISLFIGFVTVFLTITVGALIGAVSGYYRGWVDQVFMRLVDLIMAFPGILLAMCITSLLGPSLYTVIIAISCTGWTGSARLMRGQVLSIREREFVQAAKSAGATDHRIIFKHIIPETITPMVVLATFSVSSVIIVESSLSFLGFGPQTKSPTWGAMLAQGKSVLETAPHLTILPGVCIGLIVMALNFLGDALRDILDPKFKK